MVVFSNTSSVVVGGGGINNIRLSFNYPSLRGTHCWIDGLHAKLWENQC